MLMTSGIRHYYDWDDISAKIREGWSFYSIAQELGISTTSFYRAVAKKRLENPDSVPAYNPRKGRPVNDLEVLGVRVTKETRAALQARHYHPAVLVAQIIEIIVKDDLFAAVLDKDADE